MAGLRINLLKNVVTIAQNVFEDHFQSLSRLIDSQVRLKRSIFDDYKQCYTCKEVKPLDAYHKKCDSKDGLRGSCKPCRSIEAKEYQSKHADVYREGRLRANLKHKFGLDAEWYYETLEKQGGCCDICGDKQNTTMCL